MNGAKSYKGFGVYLTRDNINQYLKEREEKFNELKDQFNKTGNIDLKSYNDKSTLHKAN